MSPDGCFEDLVRSHHRAVSAYARALCSERSLAEDAVQETFLRAWRYLDSYQSTGSFEGWLLTICRRCVTDLAQRDHRQAQLPDPRPIHVPPDHSIDIVDLIGDLPLAQREVLVVCGWLGYDYQDASILLEIPVGTVRSRLHRARAALAGLLVPDEDRRGLAGA